MRYTMSLMALTAALLVTVSGQSRAGLIINGSFENGNTGVNPPPVGTVGSALPNGSTAMEAWTVFGGPGSDGVAWLPNSNGNGVNTPFGNEYLDLTGYQDQRPYFGVGQTITTTPGQAYNVSLWLGTASFYDGSNIGVEVVAGPVTQTLTDNNGLSGVWWKQFIVDFTANSNSTTISILGTQGFTYIGLDNVCVTTGNGVGGGLLPGPPNGGGGGSGGAAPEPSSLILSGIATISGLGYWWLRRRKCAAA